MKRFIVGVIIGHILWFIILSYFDIINIVFNGLCSILILEYLLYIFLQKRMSMKWIIINKLLVPIFTTILVLQWFIYMTFLLEGQIGLVLFHYIYIYRISLLFELPIIGYICYKMDKHLSDLLSE
jgi:hypothetical protein